MGVEVAERVGPDGARYLFVLNHHDRERDVAAPADGVDLLTGDLVEAGRGLRLGPRGVALIRAAD